MIVADKVCLSLYQLAVFNLERIMDYGTEADSLKTQNQLLRSQPNPGQNKNLNSVYLSALERHQ